MALDDARYIELVEQDTQLVKKLEQWDDRLHYASGRAAGHRELRDEMAAAIEKQSAKRLAKVEIERLKFVQQTQFLLYADFVTEPEKVQIFFPPPKPPGKGRKGKQEE